MPELFLGSIANDMLPTIFRKMDHKTGTKVYRTQKCIKNFIDERRIIFYSPDKICLTYQICYHGNTPGIGRYFSNEGIHIGWYKLYKHRAMTIDILAKISTLWLTPKAGNCLHQTIRNDLQAIRGFQELVCDIDLDNDEFYELLLLAQPRILSYSFKDHLKKVDILKAYENLLELHFTGDSKDEELQNRESWGPQKEPQELVDLINFIRVVTFSHCSFRFHLDLWFAGTDFGNIEILNFGLYMFDWANFKAYLKEKMNEMLNSEMAPDSGEFTLIRFPSFGKNIIQGKYSDGEIVLNFRNTL